MGRRHGIGASERRGDVAPVRCLAAVLVAAALAQAAHAEGGLPGSPVAVRDSPVVVTQNQGNVPSTTDAERAGPGGAVFSPFAEPALAAQHAAATERDESEFFGAGTLGLLAILCCVAAWLLRRSASAL